MKLPDFLTDIFDRFHHRSRAHIYNRPWLVPLGGLVLALLIVGLLTFFRGAAARPTDSHVVYLFDSGRKQTLDTKANTVGALVSRLPLHLQPQDVVEPSLSTPIVEDNFRINVYRARPVMVVDNTDKVVTVTAQKSPRVVAQAAGITVYPEDNVNFEAGDIETNTIGEQVIIERATPINFSLYGTPLTIRTQAKTVGQLIDERGIKLTKDDVLTPAPDTPLTADMQVKLVRNGTQVLTIQQDIPAPTQYVSDASLSLGATAIRQNGAAGKEAVTYQVVTQNGVETSRTVLQSTIVQNPVPEIIAEGTVVDVDGDKTSLMSAAGIGAGDFGYVNFIVSHESGWCPTKWQGEYGGCGAYHGTPTSAGIGYGLCQSTPGYKMASAGADWATNPITQLRWCSNYAASTYGGWANAYSHWVSHGNW